MAFHIDVHELYIIWSKKEKETNGALYSIGLKIDNKLPSSPLQKNWRKQKL